LVRSFFSPIEVFGFGMWWLAYRARALAHEGYGVDSAPLSAAVTGDPLSGERYLRERAAGEGFDLREVVVESEPVSRPSPLAASLPRVVVLKTIR
jgi:hypothetical protein